MSDGSGGERTAARLTPARWPGWVWAAPGAALLVVAYLVFRALAHPGVSAEVLFDTAEGVQPGQTRVSYHGLDMGTVKRVDLARDGRHIRMTLALNPDARPLLREGTRFWIVGAKPSLADINSLKTIFAGSSLEMEPGSGSPARRFIGADRPPVVAPGTPGRRFTLVAGDLGPVQEGASLYFHGLTAGKVLSRRLAGDGAQAEVFVNAPYDAQVKPHSRFWAYQPLRFMGGLAGVAAEVSAPGALLSGGVAFDTPAALASESPSPAGAAFPLYADQKTAQTAPLGPSVPYRLDLEGEAGALAIGAPVRLRGFVVGRVESAALTFDPASGRLSSPVVAALEPARVPGSGSPAGLDRMVAALVGQGLSAQLSRDPPFIGASEVRLVMSGARPARVVRGADGRVLIPVIAAPDADRFARAAGEVAVKADALPLAEIGANLRTVTARLSALTASPELADSLQHLHRSLDNLDAMTTQARPQVGPLISSLRGMADQAQAAASAGRAMLSGEGAAQDGDLPSTLRQLNDTARSVRALADYLDRHPEALIRGKRPNTP